MSKHEYLDALKKALAGLPPEVAARTMAYYEQRFIDSLAAGRTEEEIAAELDEPRKIAMTLRANAHRSAFEQKSNPATLARMLLSLIGLGIFNLFMVVPAAVFSALLVSIYASAFAFYISGIAITATGLAGANELVLTGPLRHLVIFDDAGDQVDARMQTKIAISDHGIEVFQEPSAGLRKEWDEADSKSEKWLEGAEAMAEGGVHIISDLDNESRATQTAVGIGLILLGIVLSLASIVVTRYSLIGLKRYIQMNVALLRGR
ncbi:DUF1700 domain-containing protein [Duganella sp. Root198D2]|uniref:DUF1700 domain-containing protein n=1 Tax=Duganella sp. Root198D2 TaxID=1736489 RepID=UPI0007112530|nr:DUF1700 domain-containing protein [Duganella sp. Root198D2]KRB96485.1 hypothetical protein ASE26_25885 [Duganella sp. Root198D2]